jgi:molybdopterin synthase sulfur carrier subunit
MPVKVIIPTALRPFAGQRHSVEFDDARTVADALDSLTSRFADLRRHLYADDGRLRSFVNIYVNDEDIRYLNKDRTPLKDGDTISIIPSIAGGMGCFADGVMEGLLLRWRLALSVTASSPHTAGNRLEHDRGHCQSNS